MDLVLTTRYLPLGFHTWMEMGFAMAAPAERFSLSLSLSLSLSAGLIRGRADRRQKFHFRFLLLLSMGSVVDNRQVAGLISISLISLTTTSRLDRWHNNNRPWRQIIIRSTFIYVL
jgi:hypothetical protein